MKKAIIAVIVLAIVGGAVWWFTHPSSKPGNNTPVSRTTTNSNNQPSTPTVSEDKVTFDGSSFSPTTLTVKAGATVTFTNTSDQPMWVASDPHPTHTDYSGFDELKGVGKGGTFSFKFDKVGSWGYHNHLNSGVQGRIIVQ